MRYEIFATVLDRPYMAEDIWSQYQVVDAKGHKQISTKLFLANERMNYILDYGRTLFGQMAKYKGANDCLPVKANHDARSSSETVPPVKLFLIAQSLLKALYEGITERMNDLKYKDIHAELFEGQDLSAFL